MSNRFLGPQFDAAMAREAQLSPAEAIWKHKTLMNANREAYGKTGHDDYAQAALHHLNKLGSAVEDSIAQS